MGAGSRQTSGETEGRCQASESPVEAESRRASGESHQASEETEADHRAEGVMKSHQVEEGLAKGAPEASMMS